MGSATAQMADVAIEINLEEQVSHLEAENRVLRDQVKTYQRIAERALKDGTAGSLTAMEGVILRQREQLRSHSDALWKRKQAIKKLNARYQEILDSVPAAAKWKAERQAANRESHEWDKAGK